MSCRWTPTGMLCYCGYIQSTGALSPVYGVSTSRTLNLPWQSIVSTLAREELYKATTAGEEQQLRGTRAEAHAAELRRDRDDLRRRLVELGAEHRAGILPQLEVSPRLRAWGTMEV